MKFEITIRPVLSASHIGPSPETLIVNGHGDTPLLAMANAFETAAEQEIARGRHARPVERPATVGLDVLSDEC